MRDKQRDPTRLEIWMRGILAAGISGASSGVMTGLAAVGIDPQHFNLQAGFGATAKMAGAAALINAVIGMLRTCKSLLYQRGIAKATKTATRI